MDKNLSSSVNQPPAGSESNSEKNFLEATNGVEE
jgi:hypothetical protein